MEKARRHGGQKMVEHAPATSTFAKNGDLSQNLLFLITMKQFLNLLILIHLIFVPTKLCNVVLDPLQCHILISEPLITAEILVAIIGSQCQEPERAQAVVDGDEEDIFLVWVVHQVVGRLGRACSCHEATAVNVNLIVLYTLSGKV